MSKITRFGVSVDKDVLNSFDRIIKKKGYPTRSKAIEDLIREELKKESIKKGEKGSGALILVYDHHRRELTGKLTDIQHNYDDIIVCNQHVHLTHHNCMEVIVVKGTNKEMKELSDRLKSCKGVKHVSLTIASAG